MLPRRGAADNVWPVRSVTTVSLKLNKVLVAIKPWERGLPLAATHARHLAQGAGAEMRLVTAVYDARVEAGCERGEPSARATRERTLNAARAGLEKLAQSLREWGAEVSTKVVWEAPAYEGILKAAREWHADLLVVGVHEARLPHTRLTDTDWQLIRRTQCPLLLVKDPAFDGYRTVVAAVDPLHAHDEPDGLDRAVLDAGRCFARLFGSRLGAVHAFPGAEAFELASAVEVQPGVFYGAENVEALHRQAVRELVEEYGVGEADVDLVAGAPPEVVLDRIAARHAELVVVGVPRRHGALAAVLGSTAEAVAAEAGCDVVLVPALSA
jgi:universal stress protein E